jgi:hypothetical protein
MKNRWEIESPPFGLVFREKNERKKRVEECNNNV